MKAISRHFPTLAVSTLLLATSVAGVRAQPVEDALDRLRALVEDQGLTIDWASRNVSGSNVVLVGVTVGQEDAQAPIGNLTLSGISRAANGFRIERVAFDRFAASDSTGGITIDGVSLSGLLLPDEAVQNDYGGFLFYEGAQVDTIEVVVEGAQVFSANDINAQMTVPEGGRPMEFTGAAESFTVDLSSVADSEQKAVMEALGYVQLRGFLEMAGSWQPSDGRLTLSQYDFTVVDAGTFGMSFDLGGYTPAFIGSLREIQQQIAANPDGDNAALGLSVLGLMQQLTFHGAEIAFTDDSLTNKVIEFVAQMQGMSAADITNQAKAVLPFVLAELRNPELTTTATQAVSRFLDSPGSLRITAAPAEPVPFALLVAGAMSAPESLIGTLGVRVTASD